MPSTSTYNAQLQIKDKGCKEYSYSGLLCIGQLPLSLTPNSINQHKGKEVVQYSSSFSFIIWGELNEESLEEDICKWLYKDEEENPSI